MGTERQDPQDPKRTPPRAPDVNPDRPDVDRDAGNRRPGEQERPEDKGRRQKDGTTPGQPDDDDDIDEPKTGN
jgi:hypothetical protein